MRNLIQRVKALFTNPKKTASVSSPVDETALTRMRFQVEGMSCSSCEQRIEHTLLKKTGVKRVAANLAGSSVSINFDSGIISPAEIKYEIERLGYQAREHSGTMAVKRNREGFTPVQLGGIAVIIVLAWVVLERIGVFNAVPTVNQGMGYGLLFVIGLLTSVHCIAMCGGINLSQASHGVQQGAISVRKRLLPGILYNTGRLISYTVIGGVVGALGSIVSFTIGVQAAIIIGAGVFMLLMGLNMLSIFPWMKKLTPRLPRALTGRLTRTVRGKGPLVVGLLNGFMPCGPLQSMQLYALGTGSFMAGALSMFLFSLGTVPLIFVFGAVGSLLSRKAGLRMMQISALIVLFLGLGMIGRGLALSGVNLFPSPQGPANIARVLGDRQEVNSGLTSSSYEPIIVQAGLPVRWTIDAEASQLNGCNNAISIPLLNITKKLSPGTNVVEFLPKKSGTITFTCWMGMITSTIKVVDDVAAVDEKELKSLTERSAGQSITEFAPFDVPTDKVARAETRDGIQYVTFMVEGDRYSPAVAIVKKGMKAGVNFRAPELTEDNYRIIVPSYNNRFQLVEGDNNVGLDPVGDFFFLNWTGLFYGVVLVADDPAALGPTEIESRVDRLKKEFEAAINAAAKQ